jgi:peptidoglycan/LPS O-acetylase OafA/YrhL
MVAEFHYYESPFLPRGGTGVLLFFVLSGFLITRLLLREMAETGTVSLRAFYIRRARRILPALYVAIPFSIAAWTLAGNQFRWAELWSCLGFVSNYYYIVTDMRAPNALPVTWSLAIEEQFYVLWPLVFVAFGRRTETLIRLLIVLIVGGTVYRFVTAFVLDGSYFHLYYGFDTRYDHLLTGCLLAVLVHRHSDWVGWRRILGLRPAAFTACAFLVLIEAEPWMSDRWRFGVAYAVEPALIALLIAQSVTLSESAARWLNWRPVAWLGRLSYSVYLFHLPCFWLVTWLFTGWRTAGVISFALTLLVSAASYRFVETPFRRSRSYA